MKLWAVLRDHPKWVKLSLEERGAWTTLALIACAAQPIRGEIVSRGHAEILLARDAPGCDAKALVARLLKGRLLDELPGGRIGLHDFEAWQVPPSRTRDGERERKRRQREARPEGGVGTASGLSRGEREETAHKSGSLRDGAAAPSGAAPLDEIEPVDMEDVRILIGLDDDELAGDAAYFANWATRCLEEIPTIERGGPLVQQEVEQLLGVIARARA